MESSLDTLLSLALDPSLLPIYLQMARAADAEAERALARGDFALVEQIVDQAARFLAVLDDTGWDLPLVGEVRTALKVIQARIWWYRYGTYVYVAGGLAAALVVWKLVR